MPVTLTYLPGGANSNSYVSASEADIFFDARYGFSDWASLSDDDKARLLITATEHIDSMTFLGMRVFPRYSYLGQEQALSFPRQIGQDVSPAIRGRAKYDIEYSQRYVLYKTASSSSTDSLVVVDDLADQDQYPDNFFSGGSVLVTDGDLQFEMQYVSSFDRATGTLSTGTFSASVAGASIAIVPPIPPKVKEACMFQAWYIYQEGGKPFARRDLIRQGVQQYTIADTISEVLVGRSGKGGSVVDSPLCAAAFDRLEASGWLSAYSVRLV